MMNPVKTDIAGNRRWFISFKPNKQARLRLFCFPYAGGSPLIYRKWHEALPANVELYAAQLPGRGNRMSESPFTRVTALVDAMAEDITLFLDKPFAIFGHSMGALLSFELACRLRKDAGIEPAHLFISGHQSPQSVRKDGRTYNLPEPEFIDELRRLNGTPKEVLENPELMKLMIPLLRADFEVCQTYEYSSKNPLRCSITAFGGLQDEEVTPQLLDGWRNHTNSSFLLRMLPGDHFFLHSSESILLQIISQELHRILKRID
jgi:medium-chain acyl-[acyl-carrier-protein] hydrolase